MHSHLLHPLIVIVVCPMHGAAFCDAKNEQRHKTYTTIAWCNANKPIALFPKLMAKKRKTFVPPFFSTCSMLYTKNALSVSTTVSMNKKIRRGREKQQNFQFNEIFDRSKWIDKQKLQQQLVNEQKKTIRMKHVTAQRAVRMKIEMLEWKSIFIAYELFVFQSICHIWKKKKRRTRPHTYAVASNFK